jgi:hypothetical protein
VYYFDLDSCFYKYLATKGIIKVNNFKFEVKGKDINMLKISAQLKAIGEFHSRILGYKEHMNKRLTNNAGRIVEQYKIYIKWLKRDLEKITKTSSSNEFEKIVAEVGRHYLERAEICIKEIYKNNYIDLLKRSSNRFEICLKNVYFNNLRQEENIKIINLDGCCYNMLEMDAVYFIKKLNKKKLNINTENIAAEFCRVENLDKESLKFILSMVEYPYEFMKCCNRYREDVKEQDKEKHIHEIKKIINKYN